MSAATLTLDRLVRRFGAHTVVDAVDLEVQPGELVVLLGPSGCGKTTTLRLIAGFITPDAGDIRLDGKSITALPPHQRDMGIVFQSYALFPHLTVARNVAFGLEMRRMAADATAARVQEMLRMVRLEALAGRLPRQLSGGQQQRVALARALAIHPKLLLLDEPLSNLDASLRADMAREIRLLQQARGLTTILVTHDQAEAMAMADRLVVLRDGQVQQIGSPEALHLRPATPFVAGFIGGSNLIRGRIDADLYLLPEGADPVRLRGRYASGGAVTLAVRPDSIRLAPSGGDARALGTVELCTWLGATVEHVVRIGPELALLARGPGIGPNAVRRYAAGERVALDWAIEDELLFDDADRPVAPGSQETIAARETHHA
jgi:putative spermidine/putrescine transport system ATP-binding protein